MSKAEKTKDRQAEEQPLADYRGVWVFIELERGRVHPVSWELLGKGRELADTLGVQLAAVVAGPQDEGTRAAVAGAFQFGVDLVYLTADPVLEHYRTDPYTRLVTDLVNQHKPEILLLGATTLGRDLAGAVATTLATGLTADCTELTIDADTRSMAATRPTFGGSLLCTIHTLKRRPQMAAVRPRVMSMPLPRPGRTGTIVKGDLNLSEDEVATKVLDFIPDEDQARAQLAYADAIVSAGRGLGKLENLQLVRQLAARLGAEVGCTRALVQSGWMEAERQVGQTGKTVRPKLYIAAGISGAVQHRVGMEDSDVVLSINTDPDAPIFEFSTYGVVADAVDLLPALSAAFERVLEGGLPKPSLGAVDPQLNVEV